MLIEQTKKIQLTDENFLKEATERLEKLEFRQKDIDDQLIYMDKMLSKDFENLGEQLSKYQEES